MANEKQAISVERAKERMQLDSMMKHKDKEIAVQQVAIDKFQSELFQLHSLVHDQEALNLERAELSKQQQDVNQKLASIQSENQRLGELTSKRQEELMSQERQLLELAKELEQKNAKLDARKIELDEKQKHMDETIANLREKFKLMDDVNNRIIEALKVEANLSRNEATNKHRQAEDAERRAKVLSIELLNLTR
jgi:hypothetical protein